MGQQVSVETFSSSSDHHGNKYWASFDPYPFKVGHKKLAYMGILNGEGPLKGRKCVVKALRKGTLTRKEWMLESERSKVAMEMVTDYNRMVSGKNFKYRLSVTCPITAEIDTLSDCMCLNDILGKPKKKMKEADFVAIELYLKGRFEEFEYGWVHPKELLVPEAFSHFSWCRSEGRFIVSNLQGVKTNTTYHFTSPVLHSENKDYGNTDLGYEGIKGFFRLHKCNRICHSWPRLGDGTDLRGWGDFTSKRDYTPTAPPLLMPPPYHEVQRAPSYEEIPSGYPYQNGRTPQPDSSGNDSHLYNRVSEQRSHVHTNEHLGYQETPRHMMQNFGNGVQHFTQSQFMPRQLNNSHGMTMDWREMTGVFGNQGFNHYDNQPVEMQLMWFVKLMRSYTYNNPPPPYCTCVERHDGIARDIHSSGDKDYDLEEDDDRKYLLPPPYAEESVDPKFDCITYL